VRILSVLGAYDRNHACSPCVASMCCGRRLINSLTFDFIGRPGVLSVLSPCGGHHEFSPCVESICCVRLLGLCPPSAVWNHALDTIRDRMHSLIYIYIFISTVYVYIYRYMPWYPLRVYPRDTKNTQGISCPLIGQVSVCLNAAGGGGASPVGVFDIWTPYARHMGSHISSCRIPKRGQTILK